MKLALRLDLYRAADLAVPMDFVRAAEDLGYHSVWTAEAYGSDALSPLAYLAALTTRIKLGTAVVQLAARPPATAGDARDDDRRARRWRPHDHRHRRVGPADRRGLVRPAVGQAERAPARLRRRSSARCSTAKAPVSHDGPEISLPYRGAGVDRAGQGAEVDHAPGRAHPDLARVGRPEEHRAVRGAVRRLAADGPRPDGIEGYREVLDRGFAKRRRRAGPTTSRSSPGCQVDDHRRRAPRCSTACARSPRCTSAAWAARRTTTTARRWPGAASPKTAARIQELWLAGRKAEAIAAVPDEYLEQTRAGRDRRHRIRRRWEQEFADRPA